jgi:Glutamine cyclotransferase
MIQPHTGQVTGWIDLAELKSRMPPLPTEPLHPVMNGIAYDAADRRLLITGKLWPKVFEIRVRLQRLFVYCNCGSVGSRRLRIINGAVIPDFKS